MIINTINNNIIKKIIINIETLNEYYVVNVRTFKYSNNNEKSEVNNKIVSESAINSVSVCVCLLDITVRLAKTDEPIELSFGLLTWLGPRAGRLYSACTIRCFVELLWPFVNIIWQHCYANHKMRPLDIWSLCVCVC